MSACTLPAKSGASILRPSARPLALRKPIFAKALPETETTPAAQAAQAQEQQVKAQQQATPVEPNALQGLPQPEWVPEAAKPVINFFNAQDVTLNGLVAPVANNEVYEKYLKEFVESSTAKDSLGWKPIPETINGRAAMIGFVAGVGAELFGRGSILAQLSAAGGPVLVTLALIAVATVVPVYMGNKHDYLKSLQVVYALPEGWFTADNERVHGRLAMLGLGSLIAVELLLGHALF